MRKGKKEETFMFMIVAKDGRCEEFATATVEEARSTALNLLGKGKLPSDGTKFCQVLKW